MNWILYQELIRYGHTHFDRKTKETIINLVKKNGLHEFYDQEDGRGHVAVDFSWSAVLLLNIIKSGKTLKTGYILMEHTYLILTIN